MSPILTDRQTVFLIMAARGYENKEIAKMKGISEQSVKNTFTTIYRTLGADNRTHAVIKALKKGIFTLEEI